LWQQVAALLQRRWQAFMPSQFLEN